MKKTLIGISLGALLTVAPLAHAQTTGLTQEQYVSDLEQLINLLEEELAYYTTTAGSNPVNTPDTATTTVTETAIASTTEDVIAGSAPVPATPTCTANPHDVISGNTNTLEISWDITQGVLAQFASADGVPLDTNGFPMSQYHNTQTSLFDANGNLLNDTGALYDDQYQPTGSIPSFTVQLVGSGYATSTCTI